MRLAWLLLGLVLAIAGVLAAAALVPELAPQASPHPDHPSLLRSADGAARVAPVWWLGAAFGALQIGFFGACFALGLRRGGSLGPLARSLWTGLAVYACMFALLLWSYRRFLADPSAPLVLGFPAPTAVMLFLLWPAPLWFAWLYLRHFDGWVLRSEDLERIRRVARGAGSE